MLQYFAWVTIRALNWRACACLCTGNMRESPWINYKSSIPKLIIRIIVFTAAVAHSRIREFHSISSNTFPLLLSTVSRGEEVFNRTSSSRSTGVSEFQKQREGSVRFIFRRFLRRPSFSGFVVSSFRRFKASPSTVSQKENRVHRSDRMKKSTQKGAER